VISELLAKFISTTLKTRLRKNHIFWNYQNIIRELLNYFKSSQYESRMETRLSIGLIKAKADTERYFGNQKKRDSFNIEIGHLCVDNQQKELKSNNITRILGSQFTNSFGHLSYAVGDRAKAMRLGIAGQNYVMLGSKPANSWLINNYWSQFFPYIQIDSQIMNLFEIVNSQLLEDVEYIRIGSRFFGGEVGGSIINALWKEKFRDEALLKLTKADKDFGYSALSDLGFRNVEWFVTFHLRKGESEKYRNVDEKSYEKAMNYILSRGGHVFCIGEETNLSLRINHPNFFDFGHSQEINERLDIFLLAQCRFMVGCSSGPMTIPPLFGKGVLWTNCNNLVMNRKHEKSILVPRLRVRNKRPNLDQLLIDIQEGLYENDSLPSRFQDVTIDENTDDEILFGVMEMLEDAWKLPFIESETIINDAIRARSGVESNRISHYFLKSNFNSTI
jgi:putative glycosyltransferase (TIGR04372 family)